MSLIEIIRIKPGKTFKTVISRHAISKVEYDGGRDVVIHMIGGERFDVVYREGDGAQGYSDLLLALRQPLSVSSTITVNLI